MEAKAKVKVSGSKMQVLDVRWVSPTRDANCKLCTILQLCWWVKPTLQEIRSHLKLIWQYNTDTMSNIAKQEITILLKNLKDGDKSTQDEIMKILYQELRGFAGNILRNENQTITFQATELVNEAYIRMFDSDQLDWTDRTHFLSTAIVVMRRFLVDHARKKHSNTRIPKKGFDEYDEAALVTQSFDNDVVLLDDALRDLEKLDPKQARIVELRFFGGLAEKDVAKMMKVSVSTINREWKAAKMWLMHQIRNA